MIEYLTIFPLFPAMYNYVEMRAHVNSKMFLLRKWVDNLLHATLGAAWVPLYTSVSFQRMRYSECIANKAWQDALIEACFNKTALGLSLAATAALFWRLGRSEHLLPTSKAVVGSLTATIWQRLGWA